MISIPFSGTKKTSYKYVRKIAEDGDYSSVYEPFGGSCVLSVNLLNDGYVKKAVVNDYDRFFDLYPEYLDLKDKVVAECYKRGLQRRSHNGRYKDYKEDINGNRTYVETSALSPEEKKILQEIISENVPEKYWKHFSLGHNFMFPARANAAKFSIKDFTQFHHYLKTDKQRAYLEVLNRCTIEHLDWKEFINKYKEVIDSKSLLILDPPYVGTCQDQYAGQFGIDDTEQLVNAAKELDCDFIFFNENEDQVCEWLDGLDYEIIRPGQSSFSRDNKRRNDIMAVVRK